MENNNVCPCCGRHCDLSNPHCGRGEEYLRTGKIPKRPNGGENHHEAHAKHYHMADTDEKLIINLRDIGHIMRAQYEGKASQRRILIILNEVGDITQRALTERLGIKPGSASEIIAKLENAGLLVRTENPSDRRTLDIQLTEKGKELASEAVHQRQERHGVMFSCLSEGEKQELLHLLEKINWDWKTRFGPEKHHHGHHGHHGHHDHHDHHAGEGPHGHHDDGGAFED